MLRNIESKLAGLVEGSFGRLFRSEVTPAELTRGLIREMDATRRQEVDRTWVADRYEIYLSPPDHRRMQDLGPSLAQDLSNELLRHAREQRFALVTTPDVSLYREGELSKSRYGVRALHRVGPPTGGSRAAPAPAAATAGARPAAVAASPREAPASPSAPLGIALVLEGRREAVPPGGATIGRSREADVVIASAEVSRQHCRLAPGPEGWTIEDLGSTNGVRVDGVATDGPHAVAPGSTVALGTVVLRVERA